MLVPGHSAVRGNTAAHDFVNLKAKTAMTGSELLARICDSFVTNEITATNASDNGRARKEFRQTKAFLMPKTVNSQ